MIITTEAGVTERPEKKAPPMGGGMGGMGGMGDMDF
jgi:chaperonin GroEL